MSISTVIKEISIFEHELEISVAVCCGHYRPSVHAPRIELVFDNGQDRRRFVLHENAFDPDTRGEKAVAYATYKYFLDQVFWDCKWKDCKLWMDVEYDGVLQEQVPLKVEFSDPSQAKILEFCGDHYNIHLPEEVDTTLPTEPNLLQSILAVILRICNGVLGIILLPWFIIDVCGILFLKTERKNRKIEGNLFKQFVLYVGWRYFGFCRNTRGLTGVKSDAFKLAYQLFCGIHRNKKGILFLSNRRDDLTGNFEYVYNYLKEDPNIKISFWLHPQEIRESGLGLLIDMAWKASAAKVIIVDDFVPHLTVMEISRKTQVVQLWHACGAFKTFGFSRIGKKGGPTQRSQTHRGYSYTFVSSSNIAKYYAEGFGIAEQKVIPYGVPRTDIFFDEEYKKHIRTKLYEQYPDLKGKKVVMFAPTFRGNGKNSAYYEAKRFSPNKFIEQLPEEYVLIIKHHPFVTQKYKIKDAYKNRIFDFSEESEINDLLFITDVLITDYSSVIYEASLLNIPMLFYAYDLENYIASRDFYSGFVDFVPGKIVRSEKELLTAIKNNDFEHDKVRKFCDKNFDIQDGKASRRIADFIKDLL